MARVRCEATTTRGDRCKNYPMAGVAHCGNHANPQEHFDADLVRAVEAYVRDTWEAWGRPRLREWA